MANMKPGDWLCPTCSNHNFASRDMCNKCGAPKANLRAGKLLKPGDWVCSECDNHNYASRAVCNKCQAPKPDSGDDMPKAFSGRAHKSMKPGDWVCESCDNHNFAHRDTCNKCQSPKISFFDTNMEQGMGSPRTAKAGPNMKPGDWLCSNCDNHNFAGREMCNRCKAPKPDLGPPPQSSASRQRMKPGDWECPACFNHNFSHRSVCNKCQSPKSDPGAGYGAMSSQTRRPAPYQSPQPSFHDRAAPAAGGRHGAPISKQQCDWHCSSCGHLNFASRQACQRCNVQKPLDMAAVARNPQLMHMIQAMGLAGPKMKPGDWLCPGCRNHNYASREVCGKCSIPKAARLGAAPLRSGDWFCLDCGNHNYARKTECNKCGEPMGDARPHQDSGSSKGGKGKGGKVKEGDWICVECDNHNFARRDVCNKCDAPKPSVSPY